MEEYHLQLLADFDCVNIKYNIHMPGVVNVVADTLSRPPPVDTDGPDSCQRRDVITVRGQSYVSRLPKY